MDVIIDGEKNFELTGKPTDMMAVLGAVEAFLREKGRAMLSVRIDGQVFKPEDLAARAAQLPLETVSALVVESDSIAKLIADCLSELETILKELPKACRSLAEIFHSEHPQDGFEPFHELADLWLQVKNRQRLAANAMNLDMGKMEINGLSLLAMHEELNNFLQEAAEALEQEDCILLGDLLEYELAPRAEQESDIVALLQERAPAYSG